MQSNDDHQSIVISGGYESGDTSTVEFFSPDNILPHCQCSLPSLPKTRHGHTMDGLTVCGGRDDDWVQNDDWGTVLTFAHELGHNIGMK